MKGIELGVKKISPEALTGMSSDRLAGVHSSLLARSEGSKNSAGSKHLREQVRRVEGELRRRDKRKPSSVSEIEVTQQFPTLHEMLSEPNGEIQAEAAIIEAHHDDLGMLKLSRELRRHGVRLRVLTLTDSSQRGLEHISAEELDPLRWAEGRRQNQAAEVSEMHRIGLPDTQLSRPEHITKASDFIAEYSEGVDFFFAPNFLDEHPDHAAAHEAAVVAAGKRAVYGMDTITGNDSSGTPLKPDWYVPLSRRTARTENRIHYENRSQVTNLPDGDIFDVFNLYAMTSRRGREQGVPHAAVVFRPVNTNENPLGDVLDLKVA